MGNSARPMSDKDSQKEIEIILRATLELIKDLAAAFPRDVDSHADGALERVYEVASDLQEDLRKCR